MLVGEEPVAVKCGSGKERESNARYGSRPRGASMGLYAGSTRDRKPIV